MTIDWSFLEPFQLESPQQVEELLLELEKKLKIMAKKLKIKLKNMTKDLLLTLGQQVRSLARLLDQAFTVESMEDYTQAAALYGKELAGALYQVQIKLSQFRIALIRAAEPLVRLLLPAVQVAVESLTGFVNAIGQTLRALFFGTTQTEDFADGVGQVVSAGKGLKRSLAGFDQLNRLADSGAGGLSGFVTAAELTGQWKKLADHLTDLLKPLRELDLTAAAESLKKLVKALEPIKKELFAGLQWAWDNLLLPLAKWTAEELLPVFLDTLTVALQTLGGIIEELKPMFTWLWEKCLQPLAQWAGDRVIAYLQGMAKELQGFSGWISDTIGPVETITGSAKMFMQTLGDLILNLLGWDNATNTLQSSLHTLLGTLLTSQSPLGELLGSMWGIAEATGVVAGGFNLIDSASNTTWTALQTLWGGLWEMLREKLADPAYAGIKSTINGIIGLINSVLSGLARAFNFISGSINKLNITIPDWVPILGGKQFQFDLGTVTAPQIPYLAKGAVLPANKPFLAMVGDQKHGTNVEAPLSTIQQAVAEVMDHQLGGIMAGFEAVTRRQEQILEAVLGIDLSDAAIAGATERYQRKMAIIMGGY